LLDASKRKKESYEDKHLEDSSQKVRAEATTFQSFPA
jgi:hypothetical protein